MSEDRPRTAPDSLPAIQTILEATVDIIPRARHGGEVSGRELRFAWGDGVIDTVRDGHWQRCIGVFDNDEVLGDDCAAEAAFFRCWRQRVPCELRESVFTQGCVVGLQR